MKLNTRSGKFSSAICMALIMLIFSCKKDRDEDFRMTNQAFVTEASSSNNFEVAVGALVQIKGQHQAVRHYGDHMVNDHSTAASEMTALARRKGWEILQPGEMLPKHRQQLEILAATSTDFDQKFAQIMVDSHNEAIGLFEIGSSDNGVPDDELEAMAEMKLPTLRTHLQEAITLRATVNP